MSIGDIAVDSHENPNVIRIYLRKSETDQLQKGVDTFIGRTGNDLCPVAAILAYITGKAHCFNSLMENFLPKIDSYTTFNQH